MKNKRRIAFCIATVLVLIAIAGCMMWIGRGHTIYFDNKTTEYEGQEYTAYHRAEIYVNGERVAKLSKKERGLATCMGQKFTFEMDITENKGDDPVHYVVNIDIPYNIDGLVLNIPAYLAELPTDAWQSVFVPQVTEEDTEDVDISTDGFDVEGDF